MEDESLKDFEYLSYLSRSKKMKRLDEPNELWKESITNNLVQYGPELPPEPEPIEEVSEEERLRRYSICQSCVFFERSSTTCKKSGCNVEYKSRHASYDCPWGEW